LVRVVVEWAKYARCVRVVIISAEFNRYYNAGGDDAGHQKRLKVRYNATAQRCGFKRCFPNGLFVLDFIDCLNKPCQDTENKNER